MPELQEELAEPAAAPSQPPDLEALLAHVLKVEDRRKKIHLEARRGAVLQLVVGAACSRRAAGAARRLAHAALPLHSPPQPTAQPCCLTSCYQAKRRAEKNEERVKSLEMRLKVRRLLAATPAACRRRALHSHAAQLGTVARTRKATATC